MGSTNITVLGYTEGIKLGSTNGKVLVTLLGNLYEISPGLDVGKIWAP